MAAKAAGGGRWEVVKKGRRPGAGGSGRSGGADRRALGEANGVWKYDLTREYPHPGRPAARAAARPQACPSGEVAGSHARPWALLPIGTPPSAPVSYRALPREPHGR